LIHHREGITLVHEERRQRAQQQKEENCEMMRQSKLFVNCPMLGPTASMKDRCRVIEENARKLKAELQMRRQFLDDYASLGSGQISENKSGESVVETHEAQLARAAGNIRMQVLFGEHGDQPGAAAEHARAMCRPRSAPPGRPSVLGPTVKFVERCQQCPSNMRPDRKGALTMLSTTLQDEANAGVSLSPRPLPVNLVRPVRPSSALSAASLASRPLAAVAPRPLSAASRPFSASSMSSRTRALIENVSRNQEALQSHHEFLRHEVEFRQRMAADLECLKAANSRE